ncbi:MAG: hypothetical protein ACJA02_001238 [Myxococcota bacterium]|jgi:hypothetical protein
MKQGDNNNIHPNTQSFTKAATYVGATIVSSPLISLAMLVTSKMVNEGQTFLSALTDKTNIKRSFDPQVWGRTAIRRLMLIPATAESVKMASETFGDLPDVERRIMYSAVAACMGTLESALATKMEAKQVLLSRDGVLPTAEHLKKVASAAFAPSAVRNTFPMAALLMAKEITAEMHKKNGGKPIDSKTQTAIGICCGAVAGVLSLPANVASNMAVKTGEKPALQDIFKKGVFAGWQGRAFQQGIHIGSVLISGLIIDAAKHQEEDSERKSSNVIVKKSTPSNALNASRVDQLASKQHDASNPFLQ